MELKLEFRKIACKVLQKLILTTLDWGIEETLRVHLLLIAAWCHHTLTAKYITSSFSSFIACHVLCIEKERKMKRLVTLLSNSVKYLV